MTDATRNRKRHLPILLALLLVCAWPAVGPADDIRYDGNFEMAANGDCNAVIKLTPPMIVYQKLRESVSNLYLLMRSLASSRADTETTSKKADWDDSNHSLTFSMKILGAGRNMGNHWEMEVPREMEFSNLDEAKRTLFFNQTISGDDWTIRGMARLVLPEGARDMKWDGARRVASYVLPIPQAPGGGALFVVAGCLVGLGAAATGASFVGKKPSRRKKA